jgi:F-type H+-transporting ATPase subunit delta
MTPRGVARRYAAALFDVAAKAEVLDAVERDLTDFVDALSSHDELRRVFDAPAIAPQKKRAVVDALIAASAPVQPEVARLLRLLADRGRLMLLADIGEAFGERLMERRRVVSAEVVAASPLGDARKAALAEALGRVTGRTVLVAERVDPSIIGGVIARVGSVVFDGSVTRQIERMREQLRRDA